MESTDGKSAGGGPAGAAPGDDAELRLLAEITRSMNDAVIVTDRELRITRYASAAARILGYTEAEAIGRTPGELLDTEFVHGDREAHFARLRRGEASPIVVRLRRKDGVRIDADLTVQPLRDPVLGDLGYFAVIRDVTAMMTAERERRAAEARFRAVFEHTADAILITRTDGAILSANPAAVRLFGLPEEEIRARGRAGLAVADDRLRAALAERERSGSAHADLTFVRGDGTTFIGETRAAIIAQDGGLAISSIIVRDVSGRRALEAALREGEARLHRALAGSRQVEWEYDPVNDVRILGREWPAVTGRSLEESLDRERWLAAVHPDDRELVREATGRCMRGETETYAAEYRVLQPEGGVRWVRSAGRVDRKDPGGRPVRISGVMMDVTALRELQARATTAERLAATTVLARGMAHELNSPLAGVVSNVHYAREQLAEAARRAAAGVAPDLQALAGDLGQALQDAAEGADRVKQVVADLRSFALGDLPAGPPGRTLADAVRDARRVAGKDLARCAAVEVALPDVQDLDLAHADLVQLLAHLLSNAGQATGSRPNQVRVEGALVAADRVELRVVDTGAGMSEATVARAFDPFFTTRAVGQGRGLGLSVCLGIVQAAGGEIRLESLPGEGTTVTVRLPRHPRGGA